MGNIKQIVGIIGISLALVAGLAFWSANDTPAELELVTEPGTPELEAPLAPEELEIVNPDNVNTMNPTAVLTTNKGVIEIELYKDTMPITAGNFEKLVNEGYYDGIKFHRVIDGFMIQGGDPLTKDESQAARWGTGGPGYAIPDEHIAGPLLSNVRGTISMANAGPNSGGSQFFINLVDNTGLDFDKPPFESKHPVFGRVVKGMDIVDTIGKVPTARGDRPLDPVVIEKAVIVAGS
jgi:peptidylprolyl isomerase